MSKASPQWSWKPTLTSDLECTREARRQQHRDFLRLFYYWQRVNDLLGEHGLCETWSAIGKKENEDV